MGCMTHGMWKILVSTQRLQAGGGDGVVQTETETLLRMEWLADPLFLRVTGGGGQVDPGIFVRNRLVIKLWSVGATSSR
jgi:hypothetical protein